MAITLGAALARLRNVKVVIVGQDIFIEKVDGLQNQDLHQELRDVAGD